MAFDIGDSVPLAWDVADDTGTPVNASTAVLTVILPDGTSITPAVPTPTVTGEYRVTYVPAVEGRYVWNAVTTGPNTAYGDVFEVRRQDSPALMSLADAKRQLNIPALTTTFDEELRAFMEAVTTVVEDFVGPIVRRSYTRRAWGYQYSIRLPHTQILELTSVVAVKDGSTVDVSLLQFDNLTGVVRYKDLFSRFPWGEFDITYVVGRAYVEPQWSLAARLIMQDNWRSQLGNLPAVQGQESHIIPTNRSVPMYMSAEALTLLSHDSGAGGLGFA